MSLLQVINYNNPANFTFDPLKIDVGTLLQLKRTIVAGSFTETFSSSTGFVYAATKAEFAGGTVRPTSQRPAGATFGVNFLSSINGNWGNGSLVGVASGGASVSGGKLNLNGGTAKYVTYQDQPSFDLPQIGAVRFKYTPNYSGTPSAAMCMFTIFTNTTTDVNTVALIHEPTGQLHIRTANTLGNYIANTLLGLWNPSSGTEYEMEVNWDFTAGATRVFVNGVQFGITTTTTGTRASATYLRLGSFNVVGSVVANFQLDDFIVFNSVQHTANYAPGYSVANNIYVESAVTLPEMVYTGPGHMHAVTGLTVVDSGNPRYTLQVGRSGNYLYWNGSAWVTSTRTHAQANSPADFVAHMASLPILGEIYGQFEAYFTDSISQDYIDNLIVDATGDGPYDITEPSVIVNSGVLTDLLVALSEGTVVLPPNTYIKYVLNIDGVDTWYNSLTTLWEASSGVGASNTLAEINTNLATLDLSLGYTVKLKLYLGCDGNDTPSIVSNSLEYSYYGAMTACTQVTVYGYISDNCGPVEGALITFKTADVQQLFDKFLSINKTDITRPDGYFDVDLPVGAVIDVKGSYVDSLGKSRKFSGTFTVPAVDSNLEDLI
jgi:hypothetical protein